LLERQREKEDKEVDQVNIEVKQRSFEGSTNRIDRWGNRKKSV
jgi:hypothetical protein